MKALILAAGYGTRLYALTKDTPKALLEINKHPLIDYILDRIKEIDSLDELVLVTNDKFYSVFQEWANQQKAFPHCPLVQEVALVLKCKWHKFSLFR